MPKIRKPNSRAVARLSTEWLEAVLRASYRFLAECEEQLESCPPRHQAAWERRLENAQRGIIAVTKELEQRHEQTP